MSVFNSSRYSNAKFSRLIDKCSTKHECHQEHQKSDQRYQYDPSHHYEMLGELNSLKNYVSECFDSLQKEEQPSENNEIEDLKKMISLLKTEVGVLSRKSSKIEELRSEISLLNSNLEELKKSSVPKVSLAPVLEKVMSVLEKKDQEVLQEVPQTPKTKRRVKE